MQPSARRATLVWRRYGSAHCSFSGHSPLNWLPLWYCQYLNLAYRIVLATKIKASYYGSVVVLWISGRIVSGRTMDQLAGSDARTFF